MFDSDKLAKIQARVQKLIAQAEGTDNADEAAAFMAAAQEQMAKYSIDRAMLEQSTGEKDEFVREHFAHPHAAMYWATDKSTAATINAAVGLCGIAVVNSAKLIFLYGTKQDVEYTKGLIFSVWKQQRRHMRLWKKYRSDIKSLTGADLRNVEKGFYLGFARGAAEKITESRETVESDTGGALVLASKMGDIKQFMREVEGVRLGAKPRGRSMTYSGVGYGEGQSRGRNASLGAGELGGARRSISR